MTILFGKPQTPILEVDMKIQIEVNAQKCPYWNYENQTCTHTCGGCEDLPKGNTIDTVQCGVMVDGNRYCMIGVDIYGKILEKVEVKQ